MERPTNSPQEHPIEKNEDELTNEEPRVPHTVNSKGIGNRSMKLEDMDSLEAWISEEVEAEPVELEEDDWHEALARAKDKRRKAEKLLAVARMEKEEAMRMMEEVRKNEIQAQKNSMKAEDEGEEKVATILGQARLAARGNARTVEEARIELQRKLEELDTLRAAHRNELEVVTNLFREDMRKRSSSSQESLDLVDEQGPDSVGLTKASPGQRVRKENAGQRNINRKGPQKKTATD